METPLRPHSQTLRSKIVREIVEGVTYIPSIFGKPVPFSLYSYRPILRLRWTPSLLSTRTPSMKTPLRTHTRNLRKHTPRAFPILSTALISLPTTSSCNNIHRLEAVDELYINYLAHVLEFLLYDPNLNATYQAAFNLLHNSRFQPPVNHLERILNASFQRTGGIYYGSELETFD